MKIKILLMSCFLLLSSVSLADQAVCANAEIVPSAEPLFLGLQALFPNLSPEVSVAFCATRAQGPSDEIRLDRRTMIDIIMAYRKILNRSISAEFHHTHGNVDDLDVEISRGRIIITKIYMTNTRFEKPRGADVFNTVTWQGVEETIFCDSVGSNTTR